MKRTKIVATIGPASESPQIIERMLIAGLDVARINFSHGTHQSNGALIDNFRKIAKKLGVPIGIMADLQGPRIRTIVEKDLPIVKGELVRVIDPASKKLGGTKGGKTIGLDWPKIIHGIGLGNDILIEDGLMRLKVIKKDKNFLTTKVVEGGTIRNHKGVNIPDANLNIAVVTEKDLIDLDYALRKDVDFIALSFVSSKKEIEETRRRIKRILKRKNEIPLIVSKIERKKAIENIDEIISASDVIMVARGDLGIELEESKVAIYQKEIITKSLRAGKPVIVATQMLNSMIENPLPTRAEVSDVSNAVIDHTDAVMLSGETANGKHPVRAIEVMAEIIHETEASPFDDLVHGFLSDNRSSVSSAIANSAHELAKDSASKAIVVASISGFTARMIARHRPEQNILVVTNSKKTENQLTILWGTKGFVLPDCPDLDTLISQSIHVLLKKKMIKRGDRVIIVTGRPHTQREHMSLVKVEEIK